MGLILLLILLPAQLLLERGRAGLPSTGPPPEGAWAALPGVLVTVGHSARVPPALPGRVLRRAVRRQGVPPASPASEIVLVTRTEKRARASSAGLRLALACEWPWPLVETLVIGSGLSSDLVS